MSIHIGTSGWSYNHWEGVLYPPGAPLRARLDYYIQHFQTVEVNSTFYRWPRESTFQGWRERVPRGFLLTVKAARGLTHGARLLAPERWIERMSVGLGRLGDRRGVLLVQLPPAQEYDHARLAYFLDRIPEWIKVAIEFRHPSWNREEVFVLLERYSAAYCVMSGANLPCILRVTAPFAYLRLHGPADYLYGGSYSDDDLRWWAERIREWEQAGHDVFVYFNNDIDGHAVRNAAMLKQILGT